MEALTLFVLRVGLADDVIAVLAADDAAVLAETPNGHTDFHS